MLIFTKKVSASLYVALVHLTEMLKFKILKVGSSGKVPLMPMFIFVQLSDSQVVAVALPRCCQSKLP